MNPKLVLTLTLTLLIGTLSVALSVQNAKASGTIYIRADGSIDPRDAPISTVDNVTYTLTENITSDNNGIWIQRSDIVIDGDGYTLRGSGFGTGIDLYGIENVTVRNTQITAFGYGIYLDYSSYSNISGNDITNNIWGISLHCSSYSNERYPSYNTVSGNNITNNQYGVDFWGSPSSDNRFWHNNFVNNTKQVNTPFRYANFWDDGYPSGGNYWSDYNGTDANHDGIGDTSYTIWADNLDNYPLMTSHVIPEFPSFLILPLFMTATTLAALVCRRKHAYSAGE